MLFKDDWDECRQWQAAWLRGEDAAHWALGVLAPRERPLTVPPPPPRPQEPRQAWLDYEGNLARAQLPFASMFWGGIDHPYITANLGPGSLSLFLGAKPGFGTDTIWHEPCFDDPAKVDLAFNPDNEYWQWTCKALAYYKAAARDRFLVAMPDLTSGMDCLAQLFGTQPLLMFLLECPQEIHRLLCQLEAIHDRVYDELRKIIVDDHGGNAVPVFQIWGPGRTLVTQCDFSAMISPDMFAEFVVPGLEHQCSRVDHSVYHLDGPAALRHLPRLLGVRSLTAIEWTPGTPNPYAADPCWWDKVWKPVYAAGKRAHVWAVPPDQIAPFLGKFGRQGTLITTGCESEAQARQLIRETA
jgi:hypothetical protein